MLRLSPGLKISVPPVGSYVGFTIDAEATLALFCDPDELARRAVRAFSATGYAGLCMQAYTLPWPRGHQVQLHLRPVQQHSSGAGFVPIHPSTGHRTPVDTSAPLPWAGACHPTCCDVYYVQANRDMRDYSRATYILDGHALDRYCDADASFSVREVWRGNNVFVPIVRVTPDLARFGEVGDVGEFQRDVGRLVRIIRECHERRKAVERSRMAWSFFFFKHLTETWLTGIGKQIAKMCSRVHCLFPL